MGKRVGLLAGLLVLVLGSGVVAQSPSAEPVTDTGPFVFEGRLEVPSAGIAFEAPEGWYAFDLQHPDLMAATEALDEETRDLVSGWFPTYAALATATERSDWCILNVNRDPDWSLEGAAAISSALGTEMESIDLPSGSALHRVEGGPDWSEEGFSWVRSGLFQLDCTGDALHDDWLSIAETFEFLPAEE